MSYDADNRPEDSAGERYYIDLIRALADKIDADVGLDDALVTTEYAALQRNLAAVTRLNEGLQAALAARTRDRAGSIQSHLAVMKIVGVGGAGLNAIKRMHESGLRGVELIAIDTDLTCIATV
jgi:hypothetical protein